MGCILMFLVPIKIACERQENMNQTYLLTETICFVDGVCNKGILYEETYNQFLNLIRKTGAIYDVEMEHYGESEEEGMSGNFTKQITDSLEEKQCYEMKTGDLFKVQIKDNEDNVIVFYGGCIKDEDY
ncbi:MAG: hypothetical protein IJA27_06300 [Lachnospiraceae bacterium]|nr:hypothetical protein [Lachnospiraceae bacterium]